MEERGKLEGKVTVQIEEERRLLLEKKRAEQQEQKRKQEELERILEQNRRKVLKDFNLFYLKTWQAVSF